MRNKSLFLLLAGVCGTIAAVGVGQWMHAYTSNTTVSMVEILVTTQAISAEEEITAEKLRLEQWPADRVPTGSSANLAEYEGRYAKVPLFEGEPMLNQKLMDEVKDMVVPKGYSVVSLDAGRDGTINLVRPGDRVNIRGFFSKGEIFAQNTALDVLTGVKVYGIDGITKFDEKMKRSRSARNIQLLIRKADIEAFDHAKKLGDITISLGSPSAEDDSIPTDQPSEAAQTFLDDLQRYRDEQERLRKLEEEKQKEEIVVKEEVEEEEVKKATFRTMKIVNGQIIVYEWEEGNPVPRVIADTGKPESTGTAETPQSNATPPATTAPHPFKDNFVNGPESPFFEPATDNEESE